MQCFNFSEFCFVEALHSHPPEHTVCYCLAKKKGLFWERPPQPFRKMLHLLTHRLSLFSDLLHHEELGAHLCPWGDLSPWAQRAQRASSTWSSQQSVCEKYLHSLFLQSEHEKHWPQHQGWLPDSYKSKGSRRTGHWEHSFLMGQWYTQLLGWLQMLTIQPVTNEREITAISEIPQ